MGCRWLRLRWSAGAAAVKSVGQSPERGRPPVREGATNDWLAGAATMLTHGVCGFFHRATIGVAACTPCAPPPTCQMPARRASLLTHRLARATRVPLLTHM